jgi:hypothetical protein
MSLNKPHVVVEISPAGSISIDAKCFSGSGCAKATEQIEIVLGGGASKTKKKKPEFHAPAGGKQTTKMAF